MQTYSPFPCPRDEISALLHRNSPHTEAVGHGRVGDMPWMSDSQRPAKKKKRVGRDGDSGAQTFQESGAA